MQVQLTVSSSILPSCEQISCHHHRHTPNRSSSPSRRRRRPCRSWGNFEAFFQKLFCQVLAAAVAATARRRRRACARPNEGDWRVDHRVRLRLSWPPEGVEAIAPAKRLGEEKRSGARRRHISLLLDWSPRLNGRRRKGPAASWSRGSPKATRDS